MNYIFGATFNTTSEWTKIPYVTRRYRRCQRTFLFGLFFITFVSICGEVESLRFRFFSLFFYYRCANYFSNLSSSVWYWIVSSSPLCVVGTLVVWILLWYFNKTISFLVLYSHLLLIQRLLYVALLSSNPQV